MTLTEILEKIMTDDQFVLSEIDTLSSYYHLKHTIRWAHDRTQDETESVAEHIFGMHLLIDYFLPLLEDAGIQFDRNLIRHMTNWHDMAEAFVGDMTTKSKTKEHEKNEKDAEVNIVKTGPKHLQEMLQTVFNDYDARLTIEAKFVKAIDKIEPQFHLYFLHKQEKNVASYFNLGWGADEYRAHRHPYVNEFELIKRFDDILYIQIKNSDFLISKD